MFLYVFWASVPHFNLFSFALSPQQAALQFILRGFCSRFVFSWPSPHLQIGSYHTVGAWPLFFWELLFPLFSICFTVFPSHAAVSIPIQTNVTTTVFNLQHWFLHFPSHSVTHTSSASLPAWKRLLRSSQLTNGFYYFMTAT